MTTIDYYKQIFAQLKLSIPVKVVEANDMGDHVVLAVLGIIQDKREVFTDYLDQISEIKVKLQQALGVPEDKVVYTTWMLNKSRGIYTLKFIIKQ